MTDDPFADISDVTLCVTCKIRPPAPLQTVCNECSKTLFEDFETMPDPNSKDLQKKFEEYVSREKTAQEEIVRRDPTLSKAKPTTTTPQTGMIRVFHRRFEEESRCCPEYRDVPGLISLAVASSGRLFFRRGADAIYRPALFFVLTSPPSSGKGDITRFIEREVISVVNSSLIFPGGGSPEGINKELMEHPKGVIIEPEADSIFQGGRRDYSSGLSLTYCKLYDFEASKRVTIGEGKVGLLPKHGHIFMNSIMAIAENVLHKIVNSEIMGGGLASRFLFIRGHPKLHLQWNPPVERTKFNDYIVRFFAWKLKTLHDVLEPEEGGEDIELSLDETARAFADATIAEWKKGFMGTPMDNYHQRLESNLLRLTIIFYLNRVLTEWFDIGLYQFLDSLHEKHKIEDWKWPLHNTTPPSKIIPMKIPQLTSRKWSNFWKDCEQIPDFDKPEIFIEKDKTIRLEDVEKAKEFIELTLKTDPLIKQALGGETVQIASDIVRWIYTHEKDSAVVVNINNEYFIDKAILHRQINRNQQITEAVLFHLNAWGAIDRGESSEKKKKSGGGKVLHRVDITAIGKLARGEL